MAEKKNKVIEVDRGWNALRRRVSKFERSPDVVAVGILGSEAAEPHAGSEFTNAQIGAVHEFGTEHVPRRSFLRDTIDQHQRDINALANRLADLVFNSGRLKPDAALRKIGVHVVGLVQARIAKGIPPPLAAATIRRKGSSVPLIDSGQLRSAVTYDVRPEREG